MKTRQRTSFEVGFVIFFFCFFPFILMLLYGVFISQEPYDVSK